MKIIVTGGYGFLGAHTVAVLRQSGHEVVPCSRRTGVDCRDQNGTANFFTEQKPDVVVHCAAHVGGIAYNELQPVGVFEDNIRIGLGVIDAMEKAGVHKLINIMPNCTYPGGKSIYREDEWWDGPIHPSVFAYGLPRKMLWGLTHVHEKKWGLQPVHLIFPNMYGPGDHFDPIRSHALGALIGKVIAAKRENAPDIIVWGTGKPIREWLYVEDGAQAIDQVVKRFEYVRQTADGLLNIGVGKGIAIAEMAETIRKHAGWNGRLLYDTSHPDGDMIKIMDPTRMQGVLDWIPPTDFETGVKRTVQWYMEHI